MSGSRRVYSVLRRRSSRSSLKHRRSYLLRSDSRVEVPDQRRQDRLLLSSEMEVEMGVRIEARPVRLGARVGGYRQTLLRDQDSRWSRRSDQVSQHRDRSLVASRCALQAENRRSQACDLEHRPHKALVGDLHLDLGNEDRVVERRARSLPRLRSGMRARPPLPCRQGRSLYQVHCKFSDRLDKGATSNLQQKSLHCSNLRNSRMAP